MDLRIKPYDKNSFPLGGILIKGASVESWLKEIQSMGLHLLSTTVYPIPYNTANTVWGCLVVCEVEKNKIDVGRNVCCQVVNNILFIPERSILYPRISNAEVENLFGGKRHIYHPEFGLAELEESIDWKLIVTIPKEIEHKIKAPASSIFIPKQIKTFQVKPVNVDEALDEFEKKHFPKREKFKDKPLNPFEKARLFLYKQLFTKKGGDDTISGQSGIEKTPLFSKLESLKNLFSRKQTNWADDLKMDYEELEKRNQKHLDRLMELLKNNPEEALKYAVPLDMDGTTRGSGKGLFNLQKRWFDFSLFSGAFDNGGDGLALLPGNAFNNLHIQYLNTAKELIKQKDYRKAAFIYMKLLKNYPMAAQTLEDGGYYQEAASIYLKYCNNKQKAAECYEKGQMTMNAIDLYKELGQDEKVGDLYYSLQKKKEAFFYYQKVIENYEISQQYLKASFIYKNKMENAVAAQEILLKGWRTNKDAFNCLNNYFSNIGDVRQLGNELQSIYRDDVHQNNSETFLQVLRYEYDKKNELAPLIKEMAHEIIVAQVSQNPSIVSELRSFNKHDKQLIKDTMRFKMSQKK